MTEVASRVHRLDSRVALSAVGGQRGASKRGGDFGCLKIPQALGTWQGKGIEGWMRRRLRPLGLQLGGAEARVAVAMMIGRCRTSEPLRCATNHMAPVHVWSRT